MQQAISILLSARFGDTAAHSLSEPLHSINDISRLEKLLADVAKASSLDEIKRWIH
ncbi:MAG: hypothetical protein MUF71_16755 [Candidatus Kapabacteria bacterium]|nr:hypothetical protein [Candidatus Kapabacteria bacterium]